MKNITTETKYLILFLCVNLVAPVVFLTLATWSFNTKIILPMMAVGFFNAVCGIGVFTRWLKKYNVFFITKETIMKHEK